MRSPLTAQDLDFLQMAIDLAGEHMRARTGGPFGAVIARDGKILTQGWNQVPSTNDPTAHAEICAIRAATAALGSPHLIGCVLYTNCEPCPMCLGAAYWARLERIVFAATRADAAGAGFQDAHIYEELMRPVDSRKLPMQEALRQRALEVFAEWNRMPDKKLY